MVDKAFLGITVRIMQLESNQLLATLKEKIESMIVATTGGMFCQYYLGQGFLDFPAMQKQFEYGSMDLGCNKVWE